MKKVFKSQLWFWTIIFLVFLNTLCSSLQYPGQPRWMNEFLDIAEEVTLMHRDTVNSRSYEFQRTNHFYLLYVNFYYCQ